MKPVLFRLKYISHRSLVIVVLLLTLVTGWQLILYSRASLLQDIRLHGENRLLIHISAIRRDLNRFTPMPFVLSQNREVRLLLQQYSDDLVARVNPFLEQANQVAGTRNWGVLNTEGQVIASSDWRSNSSTLPVSGRDQPFFRGALNGEYGGYFAADKRLPVYYLSAPIYGAGQLLGVAVVGVDLRQLQENWSTSRDYLLVSDQQGEVFLSSLDALRNQRLPDPSDKAPVDQASGWLWVNDGLLGRQPLLRSADGQQTYLVQSVLLDDLHWDIHFLTDLAPVFQQLRSQVAFVLGGGFALLLLLLFVRERQLKLRSLDEARELRLKNEAQQREMISNTQAGLMVLNPSGEVVFSNPRAQQYFAVDARQLLTCTIEQLLDHSQPLDQLQQLAGQLVNPARFRPINLLETLARRLDGSLFPVIISINPITWGGSDGYLVTLVDITKRKRAEQALRQANEALELRVQERTRELHEAQAELIQQSKLAALGTMAAAIAHELNQPLTAIRTSVFSSRLLLQRDQLQAAEQALEQIVSMTERMALITGQLKTFAYKKPDSLIQVALVECIEQVLPMFEDHLLQQQVELLLDYQARPVVLADQPRLEQVLINLLRNALDAMAGCPVKQLSVRVWQKDGQAWFSVSDRGGGFTEESLAHLFDPFFTTKEVGQGLGLGLAISYSIVNDFGGQIRAENRRHGGARFRVRLPLAEVSSGASVQETVQ
ncbi:ATP-binding protein [Neptuniibacter sp. CAU 1671]|uniref:ATP-binding protein n=1 Tax=Neptuniibacter sp. CAU 1671 TaxID=3032593 RepID=UPI0023DAB89E|nr:ATP-binding protein [Neptuniibacter sp. CAU 1671]MDF2181702.1 ATP-binding protein [Neptuniibacter sp. CAU 1671]